MLSDESLKPSMLYRVCGYVGTVGVWGLVRAGGGGESEAKLVWVGCKNRRVMGSKPFMCDDGQDGRALVMANTEAVRSGSVCTCVRVRGLELECDDWLA
jgi:hypothetical protein